MAVIGITTITVNAEITPVTADCVERSAETAGVPLALLWGILSQERGPVGSVSENRNGTLDHGPMQINSLWLPTVRKKFGVGAEDLVNNGCLNVLVGAWILRQELDKAPSWKGVAAYHSRTPEFAARYLARLWGRLPKLQTDEVLQSVNKEVNRGTAE